MFWRFATLAILPCMLLAAIAGCGTCGPSARVPPNAAPNKDTTTQPVGTAGKTVADDLPGLKELDAADRKPAEQQKVCPVSGELLGSMGKPYKMTVKDRVVFLCCDGCKGDVEKDPDKILKKVDELLAKNK